jgi:NAD(P)-dependent dehydrogenase (short-subunit alcohol dehydrogenase family)
MAHWTASDIPSQRGRTALVTGTGGIGLQTALSLAGAGATVVIAGRNPSKGAAALQQIRQQVPGADVAFGEVDLSRLDSIAAFAERFASTHGSLDVLINNAAVMAPPQRQQSADGFELQLATNYLGHFALTAHLLPLLRRGPQARVVSLSSLAVRRGAAIHFDNLQFERDYKPMVAYAQSKLACLIFAMELQRRSDAAGWGLRSIGAHPGISRTELIPNSAGAWSPAGLARRLLWFLFQPAAQGALPSLYAATAPEARGGAYYGPDRLSEMRGHPRLAQVPVEALDLAVAARLWEVSEQLTGTTFSTAPRAVSPAPPAVGTAS